ncbi:MAG: CARDB domain-containing protein [Acidobacteriota bacterium]
MRSRSNRLFIGAAFVVLFGSLRAYGDSVIDGGVDWLKAHQNVNGTWGSTPELTPRDTARVVMAFSAANVSGAAVNSGLGWIGSQSLDANQFLAEHALALAAAKLDSSAILARLAQQRSVTADYGGFRGHSGDIYDSALALQAFATQPNSYTTDINTLVTFLAVRQNGDGGWGIDQGFASNPLITSEVLIAFGMLRAQMVSPAVIAAAQSYLGQFAQPSGSIGGTPLLTAVALRGLLLTAYPDLRKLMDAFTSLGVTRSADGSWGGDAYVTARAIEARSMNKPNLIIKPADFTVPPSSVTEGNNVTATVTVTNLGIAVSGSTIVWIRQSTADGRLLGTASIQPIGQAETRTGTATFATTNMAGQVTLVAVADGDNNLAEVREDDNTATTTLTVNGKPDLQVFPSDIVTSPQRLQPGQQGQVSVTVHNGGESDVAGGSVSVFDVVNSGETLLQKVTFGAVPAAGAQTVTITAALASGVHTLKAVADPDAQVDEKSETNNTALKVITVSPSSSVDLRIAPSSLTVSNPRPAPGESIAISATVDNNGTDPAQSVIAFFDGPPGAGSRLIATFPISLAAQSSQQLQATYTVLADSRVIYAVADPDALLPEMDESNNAAYATLTDQYTDLVLETGSLVMPRTALSAGQSVTARIVLRNKGLVAASHVQLLAYDDLPQSGGVKVLDTFVDVPALGKIVVPAAWTLRAGQRIATAEVNTARTTFEPDYANNRATKFYTAAGSFVDDIALNNPISTAGVVTSASDLTVSGILTFGVQHNQLTNKQVLYTVAVFDDVDGDQAYNPEVDVTLGSVVVDPREVGIQNVSVALNGRVRFVPPRLMLYLDSANAVAETREDNNLFDVYGACSIVPQFTYTPSLKWSSVNGSRMLAPVARALDVNGDDVIDQNDPPVLVQTFGGSVALRRANGDLIWLRNLDTRGTQISPVIADLDSDGKPEILAHTNNGGCTHCLVALNASDGSTKWTSPELEIDPTWFTFSGNYTYVGAPAVADLDGDGSPEVISGRSVLRGSDGAIKWVGTGGRGRAFDVNSSMYADHFPDQEASIAVDLDNDGKLEVVAGNTAYRWDGTILWQRSDLPDGYTAPVYVNLQPPKICLVSQGFVYLLNGNNGTNFWSAPAAIPGGAALGGAPTVFSGGGAWFVGVAGDKQYSVWRVGDAHLMWTRVVNVVLDDRAKATNAAALFDFGIGARLVYASRDRFLILDPNSGVELVNEPALANPFTPASPTIADLDEDGHVDLVVANDSGLRVLSNPAWNGAPSIYNEFAYHVSNVSSDTAAIPVHETQTALSMSAYRFNSTSAAPPQLHRVRQVWPEDRGDRRQRSGDALRLRRVGTPAQGDRSERRGDRVHV